MEAVVHRRGPRDLTRWRIAVGGAIFVVVVGLVIGQRVALRDLRVLEQDYIAAREPTACATQSLLPFAFGDEGLDELDAAVERLVRQAGTESAALRQRFEARRVVPFPPLRSAREALADALEAQTALYDAMLADPANSDDDLRRLGRNNNIVERRLGRARRMLLVGVPPDWGRRFVCDEEPEAAAVSPARPPAA